MTLSCGGRRLGRRLLIGVALAAYLTVEPVLATASFEGRGRVVAVDAVRVVVTLDHGAIPGLLPARRSEFTTERPELLRTLRVGDPVQFSLTPNDDAHGLLTLAGVTVETSRWPSAMAALLWFGVLIVLTLVALAGAMLWRAVGEIRQRTETVAYEVRQARQALQGAREDLRDVTRAMDEVATTVLQGYLQTLRRRLGTLPASRVGNGRAASAPTGTPAPGLIVIRRGRMDIFRALNEAPGVEVIWDRRFGERRGRRQPFAPDRRQVERRQLSVDGWTKMGFVLVSESPPPPPDRRDPPDLPASRPVRAAGGGRPPQAG